MRNHSFIWFEFDATVTRLWQNLQNTTSSFAYHGKLLTLIQESNRPWSNHLESLKILDVFLSAVKSDLVGKQFGELRVINHDEFIKLCIILVFHVIKVIEHEIQSLLPNAMVACYSTPIFSRVYARVFVGLENEPLNEQELDDFYQGLALLAQGKNTAGQTVAQSLFILPVIGARLFGSVERVFMAGLDNQGRLTTIPSEDSLYWAVRDFLESVYQWRDDTAKELFAEKSALLLPIAPIDKPVVADMPSNEIGQSATPPAPTTPIKPPQQTPVAMKQDVPAVAASPVMPTTTNHATINPSIYKQKARASHTPKLFVEAYSDLVNVALPSDALPAYQRATSVLVKFDEFIERELAKGKMLEDIVFSEQQKAVRKQALGILVTLSKQGNPSAMLRLSLYLFEGRGVSQDIGKAMILLKRAADIHDIRAQKLLSRLYYQGYQPNHGGVAMDVVSGEYWLNKAADGGHTEAKKVCAYMEQVKQIKDDYRETIKSDKRYGVFFVVLGVGVLLLLIILGLTSK